MLGILLGVLKFIGFFLLGLLLLLLALIFIVLFTPIKYRVQGFFQEQLQGEFSVSWLFGIFRVKGKYEDDKAPELSVYLFGFSLTTWAERRRRRKEEKGNKKKKRKRSPKLKPSGEGALVTREKVPQRAAPSPLEGATPLKTEEGERKEETEETKEAKTEEIKTEKTKTEEVKTEEVKTEEVKMEERNKVLGQKKDTFPSPGVRRVKLKDIEEKPLDIADVAEEREFFFGEETEKEEGETSGWDKLRKYYDKFQDIPQKKEIFEAVKRLIKRLIRGIVPKDLFLKATLGTGDPVLTGYLMGLVGILTAKFGRNIQIKGDFTRLVAEDIEVRVRGKILLGSFLYAVLAFVLTKPVRRLLIKIWKGR